MIHIHRREGGGDSSKGISPLLATVLKLLSFTKKVACSQRKYYTKGISPLLATVLKPLFFKKEKSLGFKRKYYTKGISPLLATVLLIAATVVTTTMLSGWVSSTMGMTQTTISNRTSEGVACAAAEIVIDDVYSGAGSGSIARAIVRNSGGTNDLTITNAQLYNKNGDNITTSNVPVSDFDKGEIATLSFTTRPGGDSSKYGNNGSLNGGLTLKTGRYSSAIGFSGLADYIKIPASLFPRSNGTIEMWVKPNWNISNETYNWTEAQDWDTAMGSGYTEVRAMEEFRGELYYSASDFSGAKCQIWKFNGINYAYVYNLSDLGCNWADAMAAYQNNLYVGTTVGSDLGIIYRYNGISWAIAKNLSSDSNPSNRTHSMKVYNNKLYVTASDSNYNNTKIYSFDGSTWTFEKNLSDLAIPQGYEGYSVENAMTVYNSKLYVGGGYSGKQALVYSYNSTNWVLEKYLTPGTQVMAFAVYDGKLYAGAGGYGGNDNTHIWSYDGSTWNNPFNYTNSDYVMGGYSAFGKLWLGSHGSTVGIGIWSFNGTTWSHEMNKNQTTTGTNRFRLYNGILYAGGRKTYALNQFHSLSRGSPNIEPTEGGLYNFAFNKNNSNLMFVLDANSSVAVSNSISFGVGDWHHVAATWDNTSFINLYIDGILKSTFNGAWPNGDLPGNFSIGNQINGTLDEVRLWNRSLTNAEINISMNGNLPNYSNDLIGNWKLDGGILSCPSDFSRVVVTTNCGGVSTEFSKPPKC